MPIGRHACLTATLTLMCSASGPGAPIGTAAARQATGGEAKAGGTVHVVGVEGFIGPGASKFVSRAIKGARAAKADLILIDLDTSGGRVDSALSICQEIDSASPIPTAAYIRNRAWATGALIALACDHIYMRQVGTVGSATPVAESATGPTALGEKYVSAVRAKFRAWAEKKGHVPLLAEAMVDTDMVLMLVTVDGDERILSSDAMELARQKAQKEGQRFEVVKTIVAAGKLLNLTGKEALGYGLAAGLAPTRDDAIAALGIKDPTVTEVWPSFGEELRRYAARPGVMLVLLAIVVLTVAGVLTVLCLWSMRWLWRRMGRKQVIAPLADDP